MEIESLATIDKETTIIDLEQRPRVNHQLGDMEQCEAAISDLRNQRQVIQKMPHLMGKVAAAPGKAVCHEY